MSLSVALKFIYRLASRAKSDHCLTQNEMLKEIKSKVCESCHSLHCSPTHPCRASDGEKLFFFLKNTHIVHPDILFMWMEAAQMLVDGTVRQKENVQIGQTCLCSAIFMESCWSKGFHVCFHCFSRARWRAWTQTSYFILFFERVELSRRTETCRKQQQGEKKRVLTGWEHVRTWLSLSFQIQFFRVCASQWACLSFSTRSKPSILEYVDLQLWW